MKQATSQTGARADFDDSAADDLAFERQEIRRHRRNRQVLFLGRVAVPLVVLALWEVASGRLIPPFFVSSPSAVAERLLHWMGNGTIWHHGAITLSQAGIGFLIGAAAGITLGIVLGRLKRLGDIVDPFILSLYSMPKLALAPLFILWLGIGFAMKVVMSAVLVFFLVFYNTYAGVRSVSEGLINVMKVMGATRIDIMRKVVLPSAGLWVFTGLRISVPYALIGAVVGELIAGSEGLGFLIRRAQSQLDTTGVFAGLVILMVLSSALLQILSRSQSRMLRWKESEIDAIT